MMRVLAGGRKECNGYRGLERLTNYHCMALFNELLEAAVGGQPRDGTVTMYDLIFFSFKFVWPWDMYVKWTF